MRNQKHIPYSKHLFRCVLYMILLYIQYVNWLYLGHHFEQLLSVMLTWMTISGTAAIHQQLTITLFCMFVYRKCSYSIWVWSSYIYIYMFMYKHKLINHALGVENYEHARLITTREPADTSKHWLNSTDWFLIINSLLVPLELLLLPNLPDLHHISSYTLFLLLIIGCCL